jgi:hypothetical protein
VAGITCRAAKAELYVRTWDGLATTDLTLLSWGPPQSGDVVQVSWLPTVGGPAQGRQHQLSGQA